MLTHVCPGRELLTILFEDWAKVIQLGEWNSCLEETFQNFQSKESLLLRKSISPMTCCVLSWFHKHSTNPSFFSLVPSRLFLPGSCFFVCTWVFKVVRLVETNSEQLPQNNFPSLFSKNSFGKVIILLLMETFFRLLSLTSTAVSSSAQVQGLS